MREDEDNIERCRDRIVQLARFGSETTFAAAMRCVEQLDRLGDNSSDIVSLVDEWPDATRLPYRSLLSEGNLLPAKTVLAYARLSSWKFIRTLRITGNADEVENCLRTIDTQHLCRLDISSGLTNGLLSLLSSDGVFPNLRVLWLDCPRYLASAEAVARFVTSQVVSRIHTLGVRTDDTAFEQFVCKAIGDGSMPHLKTLAFYPGDLTLFPFLNAIAGRLEDIGIGITWPKTVDAISSQRDLLAKLQGLDAHLKGPGDYAPLIRLFPFLSNCQWLYCQLPVLDADSAALIAEAGGLATLTGFSLYFSKLGSPAPRTRRTVRFPNLGELRLTHRLDTFDGVVETTDFEEHARAIAALLPTIEATQLNALTLYQCVSSETFGPVADSLLSSSLVSLSVDLCPVADQLADRASQSSVLDNICLLSVAGASPTEAAFARLFSSPLPNLRGVHLAMEHLPVASMDLLASTPLPSRLCSLELINCGLTGHHLDGLAKAARFPDLRSLSLSYNNLNSDDLSSFFASVRMDNLLTLNLGELKLTAAFLAVLSRLPFFQNLIDLNLARSCKEFPDAYPQEILTHPSLHALLPVAKDRTLEAVNPLICKH